MRLPKGAVITRINDTAVTDMESLKKALDGMEGRIELEYTADGVRQEPIKGRVIRTAIKLGVKQESGESGVVFLKDR